MKYRKRQTMPRWKATLISGLAIAAGFYASAELESRNNKLFQAKKALEATQQNYDTVNESTSETAHLVITNQGRNISRR